jgi:hypothetical protein
LDAATEVHEGATMTLAKSVVAVFIALAFESGANAQDFTSCLEGNQSCLDACGSDMACALRCKASAEQCVRDISRKNANLKKPTTSSNDSRTASAKTANSARDQEKSAAKSRTCDKPPIEQKYCGTGSGDEWCETVMVSQCPGSELADP